jgi:eukaryotic-like serine/threonine-protein kinase
VLAAVWALAALILPWLVPGRRLAVDFVGASAWAAGLGAASSTLAEWAQADPPRGVTAAAVLAGGLAILVPRLLPRDIVEPAA